MGARPSSPAFAYPSPSLVFATFTLVGPIVMKLPPFPTCVALALTVAPATATHAEDHPHPRDIHVGTDVKTIREAIKMAQPGVPPHSGGKWVLLPCQ